jgi:hypothetical protein
MAEGKITSAVQSRRSSLIKPSLQTPFHIDFEWWQKNERDWHVYLRSLLCPEHQKMFAGVQEGEMIDWVDPRTAEVKSVNGIQHTLMSHCARRPEFVTEQTALVEAVFRLFLTNDNIPMTPEDLGARLNRPPQTILRTLSGPRVYKGLRPLQ